MKSRDQKSLRVPHRERSFRATASEAERPRSRLGPVAAHACYLASIGLLLGLAWDFHKLFSARSSGDSPWQWELLVWLAPLVALAFYVWHCFLKRDYVWFLRSWG